MRPGLTEVRDRQFGAFTSWQALCEYSRAELRARVESGRWVRVFRGVYREVTTPPTARLRVEAARLSIGAPSVVAAFETAAELHGFGVAGQGVTHVLGPRQARASRLIVHRMRADPGELELVGGVVATNAVRTAIDVARTADRPDALATLDAAVRQGVSIAALTEECERQRGRRGGGQASELVGLADGRAESPAQSRVRLLCIDAGLPHPVPQVRMGEGPQRVDLGWPDKRIGIRCLTAPTSDGQPVAGASTSDGWVVLLVATEACRSPENLLEPIRFAMERR